MFEFLYFFFIFMKFINNLNVLIDFFFKIRLGWVKFKIFKFGLYIIYLCEIYI